MSRAKLLLIRESSERIHMSQPPTSQRRALIIAAHPDDADFGAAGTLAQWCDQGWEVTLLVCTRGDQGGFDAEQHLSMPQIREQEQREAAAVVGYRDVRFLDGHRDGWLQPTYELQRQLVRVIRQVRPDRMIIPSAERWYERIGASHPDHLAAGEAAIRAIYPAAENQFAWPELIDDEGLHPFRVNEFWVMSHPRPNHVVDITDYFERKVKALGKHRTQTGTMADLEGFLRQMGTANAELRLGGEQLLGDGRLGEAFLRVQR